MALSYREKTVPTAAPMASRIPRLDGRAVTGDAPPREIVPGERAAPRSGDAV